MAQEGRGPISVVWVDTNKGDDERPAVRCRLCVAETKKQTTMDLNDPSLTFSATPPYEALRMIISLLMTLQPGEEDHVLMFLDETRAHPPCVMRRMV